MGCIMVIAGRAGAPYVHLFINRVGQDNQWIQLVLEGTTTNRDAIGAKVKVTTASGRTLHNHVSVSRGFMSSSDRRVHIGLGGDTSIQSVEITWPSGQALA